MGGAQLRQAVQHGGDVADAGGDQGDHEGVDLARAEQQVDDLREVPRVGAGAGVHGVGGADRPRHVPGHGGAQAG